MVSRAIHLAVPVLLLATLCVSSWRSLGGIYSLVDGFLGFAILLVVLAAAYRAICLVVPTWRHAAFALSVILAGLNSPLLLVLSLLIAGVELIAEKRFTGHRTMSVLAVATLVVFAMTTTPLAIDLVEGQKAQDIRDRIGKVPEFVRRPSIFHIILDGYGDPSVLRDELGHDPSQFIAALEERGFRTYPAVRTAFNQTLASLASVMNGGIATPMDASQDAAQYRRALGVAFRESDVLQAFRSNGYEIAYAPSGYAFFDIPGGTRLSRLSLLPPDMATFPLLGPNDMMARTHRDRLANALDGGRLRELHQPYYYLQHILAPHPPFVVDQNGDPRADMEFINDGTHYTFGHDYLKERYREGYREKALFIERQLIAQIDALPVGEKIIIIHGDHGPGSNLDHEDALASCARERMLTFAAVYSDVPEVLERLDSAGGLNYLPNLFRRILFNLTGEDFPDLAVEQYFLTFRSPNTPVQVSSADLEEPCNSGG